MQTPATTSGQNRVVRSQRMIYHQKSPRILHRVYQTSSMQREYLNERSFNAAFVTDPKEEEHLPLTVASSCMRAVRRTFLVFAHRFSLQGRGHVWAPSPPPPRWGWESERAAMEVKAHFWRWDTSWSAPRLLQAQHLSWVYILDVHYFGIQAPTHPRMKSGWGTVSLGKQLLTQKDNQTPPELCRWHKCAEYTWILCCFASDGPLTCTWFLSATSSNFDFYLFIGAGLAEASHFFFKMVWRQQENSIRFYSTLFI